MFSRTAVPVLRRSLAVVRPLSTTAVRRADPYQLPFSDPALAAAASRSPQPTPGAIPEEEWPMPQPLDRSHEDEKSLRSRLVYQTRKRGTLESDLLLSTFARDQLGSMSIDELREFDKMLDEPDWDIFYWSVHKKDPPPRWKDTELLKRLQRHAKNEGKVVRMMPALADKPAISQ